MRRVKSRTRRMARWGFGVLGTGHPEREATLPVLGKTARRRPTHPSFPGRASLLNAADRRDLASLGLMVLVYGLAVAPVLHAVVGHGGAGARHEQALVSGAHSHESHRAGPVSGAHSHDSHRAAPVSGERANDSQGAGRGSGARAHPHESQRNRPGAPDESGHGPDGHQHLTGSVEHLHAAAAAWAVVDVPRLRAVSWLAEVLRGPRGPRSGAAPDSDAAGPVAPDTSKVPPDA